VSDHDSHAKPVDPRLISSLSRYDVVCPVHSAWELHKVLPASALHVVQTAGHSGMEPPTVKQLVLATNSFKQR
jgi:proline iminopeptidase